MALFPEVGIQFWVKITGCFRNRFLSPEYVKRKREECDEFQIDTVSENARNRKKKVEQDEKAQCNAEL